MKSLHQFIISSMRELIFGLEDSLVSTLGTVTGIAIGSQSTYIVILSAFVLIASESTSMAAGSYLSSISANEAEGGTGKKGHPIRGAAVMGVSYTLGGFIPVLPYFFLPTHLAILPSVIMTVVTLFMVGIWAAKYTKQPRLKSGFTMATISLSAAFIGYVIGRLVSHYYGINLSI